jgi:hypothetical protein
MYELSSLGRDLLRFDGKEWQTSAVAPPAPPSIPTSPPDPDPPDLSDYEDIDQIYDLVRRNNNYPPPPTTPRALQRPKAPRPLRRRLPIPIPQHPDPPQIIVPVPGPPYPNKKTTGPPEGRPKQQLYLKKQGPVPIRSTSPLDIPLAAAAGGMSRLPATRLLLFRHHHHHKSLNDLSRWSGGSSGRRAQNHLPPEAGIQGHNDIFRPNSLSNLLSLQFPGSSDSGGSGGGGVWAQSRPRIPPTSPHLRMTTMTHHLLFGRNGSGGLRGARSRNHKPPTLYL